MSIYIEKNDHGGRGRMGFVLKYCYRQNWLIRLWPFFFTI